MRLVGGSNPLEGRVEVCINRAWGTICDNGFSSEDATVICNQLNIPFLSNLPLALDSSNNKVLNLKLQEQIQSLMFPLDKDKGQYS
ncbi:MAG: hypothetical protein A6F71_05880 [Cycloclasticus sp. symbiont of Poecilosclerida sp. M]|nr:MAG: hypothetical protein A6F71_05880 [Cycloclasticus sp. symbiont of Poecilosclerida sp. M]